MPTIFRTYSIATPVDVIIGDVFAAESLVVCAEREMPYYIFNCAALISMMPVFQINEDTPIADTATNPLECFVTSRPKSEGPPLPVAEMMKKMVLSMNNNFKPAKGFLNNSLFEFDKEVKYDH